MCGCKRLLTLPLATPRFCSGSGPGLIPARLVDGHKKAGHRSAPRDSFSPEPKLVGGDRWGSEFRFREHNARRRGSFYLGAREQRQRPDAPRRSLGRPKAAHPQRPGCQLVSSSAFTANQA